MSGRVDSVYFRGQAKTGHCLATAGVADCILNLINRISPCFARLLGYNQANKNASAEMLGETASRNFKPETVTLQTRRSYTQMQSVGREKSIALIRAEARLQFLKDL